MSQTYTLKQLNTMPEAEFIAVLGGIYEHSPWVAQGVAARRPFANAAELADAMRAEVDAAGDAAQIRLVRAHPELAGKAAVRGELTAESTREQSGAGLDRCSPEEFARLQALNQRYNEKFGFPFILAVRGYDRAGIIAAFGERVENEPAVELQTCINQIHRIAQFRLNDLVSG
ncbi:OHCU decarboxylase [Cupriavidus sp. USMAA2-4]|uniref:2-oxo-4-hydroxy-4-carboxy-5-ureidoimidazoline decarboxylase n=1 Tax=Cupriavidus sp. USMAA2-4 TaxID=876364 RepID=UPI0008A6AC81|nr:2-oxo-4-hydroxy-4-carboxy-5-ureidoimidazoline decarboxylase [Cupriavidus sp. USMAA2-4]AOY91274.1 OHCU decarboxylase [Cupriavidus sp. USMAA2-4]